MLLCEHKYTERFSSLHKCNHFNDLNSNNFDSPYVEENVKKCLNDVKKYDKSLANPC